MNNNNILYLSDRISKYSNEIPAELFEKLKSLSIIQPDKEIIHFTGLVSFGRNKLAVFLPRNFDKNSPLYLSGECGRLLLFTLRKYYNDKNSAIYETLPDDNIIGGENLSTVLKLLDDYQNNGLYVRKIRQRTRNIGKTNWVRTVARHVPYPSGQGPVYLDLEASKNGYTDTSIPSRIHATIIKSLVSMYGPIIWSGHHRVDNNLDRLELNLEDMDLAVHILERELHQTFSERDIFILKMLIHFLRGHKGSTFTDIIIGTRNFHNVWELMLDDCLDGNIKVNDRLPLPVYKMTDGKFVPALSKSQRTDTVLKSMGEEERYAVIDAKYYGATSVKSAPGWSDLVKQLFYQKMVAELFEVDNGKVTNHFVFPGHSSVLESVHISKRGEQLIDNALPIPEYLPIHCHYQEPLELLACYVDGRKLTNLQKLIFSS